MKLLVGLGNPGKEYDHTRHNMGFDVVNLFAEKNNIKLDRNDFKAIYGKGVINGEQIIVALPQTYMNLSGQSVVEIVNFFKIDIDDIIVVYDDMALEPGVIRLRENGSSGGQKGIQNIIDLLGTQNIHRIRVGTGEPKFDNTIDYVLTKPSGDEKKLIELAIEKATKALDDIYKRDFHHAMSIYNSK